MKNNLYLFIAIGFLYSCKSAENNVWEIPTINSISLAGMSILQTEISDIDRRVTIWVPYQTNVTSIVPTIVTKNAISIIPSSNVAQNFSSPVYYTLVSESGQKVIYEIQVKAQEQPMPLINRVIGDTLEAGMSFQILGRNFGLNPTEVQASVNSAGNTTHLKTELLDSLHIRVFSQDNLLPGSYTLALKVKNKITEYNKSIIVQYPTPLVDSLDYWNVIQEENIQIFGKYLSKNYDYNIVLIDKEGYSTILPMFFNDSMLMCKIPVSVKEGVYSVKIINTSLKKESKIVAKSITVYRKDMPYLIYSEKITELRLKPSSNVVFTTANFEKTPARFYQIQLESNNGSFMQNALYSAANNRLTFTTPQTKGRYSINLVLSNETNILYQINTRFILIIE